MALTDKIIAIADKIRKLTGITDKMTLDEIASNMDLIKTNPILQDKSVEITENGTTNIVADEGYDGLGNVEVTTNVAGAETPEKGFIVKTWNETGYATEVEIIGMNTIPSYAFAIYNTTYQSILNKYLEKVTISNNVTTINDAAFANCSKLNNVNFSSNLEMLGNSVFFKCTNLTTIDLPSGLTSIGNSAFGSCTNLTTVNLPSSLTTIGISAFAYCTKLTTVNLPSGLSTIPRGCFNGCTKLNIKTVPDSVTTIEHEAFEASGITQMSVKNATVEAFRGSYDGSFFNCSNLRALWLGGGFNTQGSYLYTWNSNFKKLFINLPRVTVETLTGYNTGFQFNSTQSSAAQSVIVCNDDEGWMTKEEFDAIDWATYTV